MERRHFLTTVAGLAASLAAPSALAQACPPRTDPNIEGPFYRAGAPHRAALTASPSLLLAGTVRDTACRPMRDAVLELWQADAEGEYDLGGDRFRAIVRTDEHGAWSLATLRPGRYLNGPTYRPAHIHVKVHATRRPPLTTQLYFQGDPYNDADPWFRRSLLITELRRCSPGPTHAHFDFVV